MKMSDTFRNMTEEQQLNFGQRCMDSAQSIKDFVLTLKPEELTYDSWESAILSMRLGELVAEVAGKDKDIAQNLMETCLETMFRQYSNALMLKDIQKGTMQ